MPITATIDHDRQLAIQTVIGEPFFEEGMATLKQFWEGQHTRNVLWDFRKASLAGVSSIEEKAITDYIKSHSEKSSGGKTPLNGSTF